MVDIRKIYVSAIKQFLNILLIHLAKEGNVVLPHLIDEVIKPTLP